MNTPAHLIVGTLACGVAKHPERTWPVVLGSIAPDLPMYLFYVAQRAAGSSEGEIWSKGYYADHWQLCFDWFNSAPLMLALLVIALICRNRWCFYFAVGAVLHISCDLPLHYDDGHRHFLPFSDWRFRSPVSYWDPRHFGLIVAPLELLATIGGAAYLAGPGRPRPARLVGLAILALYLLAILVALGVWIRSRV